MLRLLKRLDEAIQHGETAVRLAPGQAVYYSNSGIAYYDQKNHEQAEMRQRNALALNPDLLIALNNVGSILRERKQRQEAVSYFRRALQIAPDHWEAMNNPVRYWLNWSAQMKPFPCCSKYCKHSRRTRRHTVISPMRW